MELFLGIDTAAVLAFALAISLVAGAIKGLVGFALPMLLVSGLGSIVPAEVAIAGMILPTLVANGWQALRQGMRAAFDSMAKFRTFLIAGFVVMMGSARLVPLVPGDLLLLLLGVLVTVFALLQLLGIRPRLSGHPGRRVQAAIGAVAGFMGGLSGIWGPPTVVMLTALDTEKKEQMRIQGVIYSLGAAALTMGHVGSGVLRAETLPLSLALVPTVVLGMALGLRIQDRIDQRTFRTFTLAILLLGGLNLIRRGLMG